MIWTIYEIHIAIKGTRGSGLGVAQSEIGPKGLICGVYLYSGRQISQFAHR